MQMISVTDVSFVEHMRKDRLEVLVIDDEPSVADALKMILEDRGFRVVVALTGREGLEQARRGLFDLTITDLRLPDMSGLDVLRAICGENGSSLCVLITSHATPEISVEARACGAYEVLSKPFLPSDIVQLIDVALGERFEACTQS
jgi:two-component system response regulator PilR (NtrC family)